MCVRVCVQSPERVVVKVDHAVVAGLFTDERGRELLAASQRQITGQLVDSAGNTLRQVSVPGKPDKVINFIGRPLYLYL